MGEWYLHEFVDTPQFFRVLSKPMKKGQATSSQAQIRLHFFKKQAAEQALDVVVRIFLFTKSLVFVLFCVKIE